MVAKASIVHLTATDGLAKNFPNVHEHVLSVTPTRTALALATLGAMREIELILFVLQRHGSQGKHSPSHCHWWFGKKLHKCTWPCTISDSDKDCTCLGHLGCHEINRNDPICVAAPMAAKVSLVLVAVTDGFAKNFTNLHDHVVSVTATRTALVLCTLGAMR